jgi:hypothetical protein
MDLTQEQESVIASDKFEEDEFLKLIEQKEEQLQSLNMLDTGFERIYESVKEELTLNKSKYQSEVIALKEYIGLITDLSVKTQALERRNKSKLEIVLAQKRKEIKNSRMSNQSVTNYYKTMAMQHEPQSYFYDKKK